MHNGLCILLLAGRGSILICICLDNLIEKAFTGFKDPTTPIQIARLKNNIAVAELFHGPTLAFKVGDSYPFKIGYLENMNLMEDKFNEHSS